MTMTEQRWTLLDQMKDKLRSPAELGPEVFAVIADRLEDAVSSSSRSELDAIKMSLKDFFLALLQKAPSGVAEAVRADAKASQQTLAAFNLGQVSFAQHFAAQAAERRADDDFTQILKSKSYSLYLSALLQHDRTGQDLSRITSERSETVSRKLKRLRELGIVDCRRDGTALRNFLTPAARAALLVAQDRAPAMHKRNHAPIGANLRAIQTRHAALRPYLQSRQTLASSSLAYGN